MKMPSFTYKYTLTLIFFTIHAFSFINSLPVTSKIIEGNPYDEFITFLSKNNCKMPSEIALPFQNSSDPSNFNYLSTPLRECQTTDALQTNDEAYLLCKEIFDVLQNITCYDYKLPTKIDSTNHLSEDVCKDFSEIQYVLPQRKDYLSARLKDDVLCGLMCTKEKYEFLCKTLLWSYDALEKIESVADVKLQGDSGENKISDGAVSQGKEASANNVDSNKDKSSTNVKQPKTSVNDNKSNRPVANSDDIHPGDQNSIDGINSNNAKDSNVPDQIPQIKSDTQTSLASKNSSTTISENEPGSKITSTTKNSVTTKGVENKQDPENLDVIQKDSSNEKVHPVKQGLLPDLNIKDQPHDNQENDVNVDELPKKDGKAGEAQQNPNTNNLPTGSEKIKSPQQAKNTAINVSKDTKESEVTVNNNGTSKATTKSDETTIAPDMKNELSNVDLEEDENKNTGPKTQEGDKEVEKPKVIDPTETTSLPNSPVPEPTTPQILPDDEEPHQEDKEPDQYSDAEKEDDYPKPDYDPAFNPPTKNKDSNVKGSIIVSSQISNNYDVFNPRNNIGRIPEDIPMIPSLPEQEDGHFFFYFLSIVLILMAGYLIFHNKQKIIALIVEGRHERRRRSHGVGYKKLETK